MNSKDILEEEFNEILLPIINNNQVQRMKDYIQHCDVSCYEHCMNVAYYTYYLCKKMNLDYKSATRAAMLHDFFLYDWRVSSPSRKKFHGFVHPKISLENALLHFSLSDKEQDMILKHMWPITIKLPKFKESYILTLTDKFSTLLESYQYLRKKPRFQRIYANSILFFAILFLKL